MGQGLGLKIVKDLTGLLNGNIKVTSEEQKGTSFNITIPFEVRDVREKRKSIPKGSGIVLSKRMLVVEDEEINQMLFMKTFINNNKGYQLEMAQNGNHAFELLNKKKYDAIILKKTLTDMDTLVFIEKLRGLPNELIATIPILMASGSTMLDEQERFLSAGATAFLTKPYTKRALFKILEKLIQS
jgi:CheY-like chemotaxis protein